MQEAPPVLSEMPQVESGEEHKVRSGDMKGSQLILTLTDLRAPALALWEGR